MGEASRARLRATAGTMAMAMGLCACAGLGDEKSEGALRAGEKGRINISDLARVSPKTSLQ